MTTVDGGTPTTDFSTTEGVIDYTLPLGKVRLLITDVSDITADRLFTDAQLDAFLDLCGGNVWRTAAKALVVIAASELMVSKVIRTQDKTTDGAKVSAELRALAATYEAKADADDAAADVGFFEVVPFGSTTTAEGVEAHW